MERIAFVPYKIHILLSWSGKRRLNSFYRNGYWKGFLSLKQSQRLFIRV